MELCLHACAVWKTATGPPGPAHNLWGRATAVNWNK